MARQAQPAAAAVSAAAAPAAQAAAAQQQPAGARQPGPSRLKQLAAGMGSPLSLEASEEEEEEQGRQQQEKRAAAGRQRKELFDSAYRLPGTKEQAVKAAQQVTPPAAVAAAGSVPPAHQAAGQVPADLAAEAVEEEGEQLEEGQLEGAGAPTTRALHLTTNKKRGKQAGATEKARAEVPAVTPPATAAAVPQGSCLGVLPALPVLQAPTYKAATATAAAAAATGRVPPAPPAQKKGAARAPSPGARAQQQQQAAGGAASWSVGSVARSRSSQPGPARQGSSGPGPCPPVHLPTALCQCSGRPRQP